MACQRPIAVLTLEGHLSLVSLLPMNSARVRHWRSTWDTKQRTNASYHMGEPQKKNAFQKKSDPEHHILYNYLYKISPPQNIYIYMQKQVDE